MSNAFNTDGMDIFCIPSAGHTQNDKPLTTNAFESIECTIAFDVRDWKEEKRSAWIYMIVFGVDEESWDKISERFGWDSADKNRAELMHKQWVRAKEAIEWAATSSRPC